MGSYQKLFDERELIKKSQNIEVSELQKESTLKWIEKIKNKELIDEERNYNNFSDYILKNILNYSTEDILANEPVPNGGGNVEFCLKNDENKIFCLIELKGQNADLDKKQSGGYSKRPTEQGSLYADYFQDLDFFVVSNYNKFIFFSKEYKLSKRYELNFEDFDKNNFEKLKIFLFLFSKEFTSKKVIESQYQEYIKEETEFSKKFYKLFFETLKLLTFEIEKSNENISRKESIFYAQKIMDRFIFTCFAEDNDLLNNKQFIHTNFLEAISKQESLWKRLNEIFRDMNKSKKDSFGEIIIPEFNGEFFSLDLENRINIEDKREDSFFEPQYFEKYTFKKKLRTDIADKLSPYSKIFRNLFLISNFDFNSDLNVNILGHIFENSLSDIELLKNEEVSKRKQDGIFYTPEYITDYMCRNTIVPYLSKQNCSDVDELIDEYSHSNQEILELEKKLSDITIVDPACGSGAFLNKAVEILLEIWNKLEEVKTNKGWYSTTTKKGSFISFDRFNQETKIKEIIKNNIYGVDLNAESVEISKLSLFLKISNRSNPKLINLNNNIKCGNSLIGGINEKNWKLFEDDIREILLEKDEEEREFLLKTLNRKCNKSIKDQFGDEFEFIKSFNWELEFIDIFFELKDNQVIRRGFDVVIGNPPYVRHERIKEIKPFLEKNYEVFTGTADLLVYFFEKGIDILKKDGQFAFIVSNKFARSNYGKNLRRFILDNTKFLQYIDEFKENQVFDGATVDASIIHLKKNIDLESSNLIYNYKHKINQNFLTFESWSFGDSNGNDLMKKLNKLNKLKQVIGNVRAGIKTGFNKALVLDDKTIESLNLSVNEKKYLVPFVKGSDIKRNLPITIKNKLVFLEGIENLEQLNNINNFLIQYKKELENRSDIKGKNKKWYQLRDCAFYDEFYNKKIIFPDISNGMNFTFDDKGSFMDMTCMFINTDNKYYLLILNSSVSEYYFRQIGSVLGKKGYRLKKQYIEQIPIPEISSEEQQPFIEKADIMLELNKEFYNEINFYTDNLKIDFELEKVPKKLEKFYELSKEEYLKELKKISKATSKIQQYYLEFDELKDKVMILLNKINKEEEEINKMVYKLYHLTDEEIRIIEEDVRK